MDDQAAADQVGRAGAHRHAVQREAHRRIAVGIALQRRQVAGVMLGVLRAVHLARRVEVSAGAHAVAAGAVALLVQVKAVLLSGLEAGDLHGDLHQVTLLRGLFGGGRSPVSDLRHARFDQLCIDPALIAGLDHDKDDAAIVEHLISLAHRLGMTTVAGRVETASQLAMLRTLGCDRAEGPFLGVPLRDAEVDALLCDVLAPSAR